jgi:glycosyltransferase involved in cell wall biosynthesis
MVNQNITEQSPLFSVIIPTHNRAYLLTRAIQSVLNQTFSNFELLVVDDLSSDNTKAVVKSFADPRIVYIARSKNGGAAASRNTAIRKSRGRYIAFLDDDDEYLPRFLEAAAQTWRAASTSIGITWCRRQIVMETNNELTIVREEIWIPKFHSREDAYCSFLRTRRIGTADGLTVRRTVFDNIGLFDERMRKAEDTDFLIRLVRHYDFVVIPELLIRRYEHAGPRLTHYDSTMAEAYERIIAKNVEILQSHPDLWAATHYKTAWLYYHGRNKVKGRHYMQLALRANLVQPRLWIIWLLFEIPGRIGPNLHRLISLRKTRYLTG